jgi:hypothetical protein
MKRQYLIAAALALVVVAAYFSREHFGPTNDINLGMNPVPTGAQRQREMCADQTRAEPGQCSLDSMNGPYQVMPF